MIHKGGYDMILHKIMYAAIALLIYGGSVFITAYCMIKLINWLY